MSNRFVILLHTGYGRPHCDLMLQVGQVLAAWQFDDKLLENIGCADDISCTKIADHRAAYLDYEGPVTGGRGEVRRMDHGEYDLLSREPSRWVVRFAGQSLRGEYELVEAADDGWLLRLASVPGHERRTHRQT